MPAWCTFLRMGSMDFDIKQYATVGAVVLVVVCVAIVKMRGCNAYSPEDAGAESAEVQEALEMLRAMAQKPSTTPDFMSADSSTQARDFVMDAAEVMSRAQGVEHKASTWFGDFLRVTVTCPRDGAKALEKTFYLKKVGGQMRVTGMETQ